MRILMIGAYPLVPGVVNGGVEAATSALVHALADRDDVESVTVLRFHHGDAPVAHRREHEKVEVFYLSGQRRLRTLTRSFFDVRRARRLIAQLNPDVVHGQEIAWNGEVAVRCRRDCVVTVHGMVHVEARIAANTTLRSRVRVRMIESMVRRILRRAKVVVSISQYDADELGNHVKGRRVSIANPVDPQFFTPQESLSTPPRLLFAGVVRPLKNLIGLIDAFAKAHAELPDSRLSIFGPQPDADYAQRVRDHVVNLGLSGAVDVAGPIDTAQLRRELADSRAVVLFSHQEVAPTIIAQAMAAGKPVLASRVGGIAEMVRDGENGFLVDSTDESRLADRMVELLGDQDLCFQMGRRGHELALSTYASDVIAGQTVEAYRELRRESRMERRNS
jgi:glycosyltransferase involved in cell wall biosynthesis